MDLPLPERATPHAAGLDLRAAIPAEKPGCWPPANGAWSVNGGGTNLSVNTENSSFSGNGIAKTFGGSGDIDFFEFTGNAAFTNVAVTGTAQGTSLAGSGDNGIQISGFDEATHDVTHALGNVLFDNVSVTGTYAKTLVYIQGYDDASGLTFPEAGLILGDVMTQTGWTSMFVDLGPQGGSYTADPTQPANDDLAGVTLAGWSLAGNNATFAALAAAGLDDLIVGTPDTTDITGTPGDDAIVYNQAVGGVEHVDGGAGTDASVRQRHRGGLDHYIHQARPTPSTRSRHRDPWPATRPDRDCGQFRGHDHQCRGDRPQPRQWRRYRLDITGDLHGTGVATSTVTINGGTGNDTVDASGMTGTPVDIVFNGNGRNSNTGSETVRVRERVQRKRPAPNSIPTSQAASDPIEDTVPMPASTTVNWSSNWIGPSRDTPPAQTLLSARPAAAIVGVHHSKAVLRE